MKRLSIIFLTGIILSGCTQNRLSSDSPITKEEHIYPFKSAILKFVFEDRGTQGEREIYIDDWGTLYAEHVSRELRNDDMVEEHIIRRGTDVYTQDFEKNIFVKTIENNPHNESVDLKELSKEHGDTDKAIEWLDSQGIHLLGNDKVLGYDCQVLQEKQGPIVCKKWIYKGVPLKIVEYLDPYMHGVRDENVTDIQFDINIDPNYFKLPDGIEIVSP